MEPVEINAGAYYLRQLRADDRVDDRPALVAAFADPLTGRGAQGVEITDLDAAGRYVARRAEEWAADRGCSWVIADPVSGELRGEVSLTALDLAAGTAEVACWTHPDHRGEGVMTEALPAVVRFGLHGLGLREIGYHHAESDQAARRLAEKAGFTPAGPLSEAAPADGEPGDLLRWRLPATDAG